MRTSAAAAALVALLAASPAAAAAAAADPNAARMTMYFPPTVTVGQPLQFNYSVVGGGPPPSSSSSSSSSSFPVDPPQVRPPLKLTDAAGNVTLTVDQISDRLRALLTAPGDYAVSAKLRWPRVPAGVANLTLVVDVWPGSLSLAATRYSVLAVAPDAGYPGDASLDAANGPDYIVAPKATVGKSAAAAAADASSAAAYALPAFVVLAAAFF